MCGLICHLLCVATNATNHFLGFSRVDWRRRTWWTCVCGVGFSFFGRWKCWGTAVVDVVDTSRAVELVKGDEIGHGRSVIRWKRRLRGVFSCLAY